VEPPADVEPRELAPEVRSQLRTLSKVAADRVARHLVAAGRLVDDDPPAALEQARAARALGARVAVVREAVGETAYAAGEWAEAIAELRTARRMTGDDSALPLIADAERALGRPERALRIAQSPEVQGLAPAERAEMRIVEAGARRDLGQLDAALVTLQDFGLDPRSVRPWSARVWYAYADLLLAAGREDEARDWFLAAAGADPDGTTDADERLLELDGIEILTDEDDEILTDETPVVETPVVETPVVDGTPGVETPGVNGTSVVEETPVVHGVPVLDEASVADEASVTDVSVADDVSVTDDVSVLDEASVIDEASEANEARGTNESSVVDEASAAYETSVTDEASVISETVETGEASADGAADEASVPGPAGERGTDEDADADAQPAAEAVVGDPVPIVFSDQADQSGSSS
jgi:tetratricopeptide (TPR) repeat protein